MSFRNVVRLIAFVLAVGLPTLVAAQANGRLQIHYMDVGQGDGAVLISPLGQVVLFDNGVLNQCAKPIGYLQALGVTRIDYHVASHYHSDHIGCTGQVLSTFPLQQFAYDRGGSYTTATYTNYVTAVGTRRRTATPGTMITLDQGSLHPVQILFVAANANGIPTTDENDLSVVALVRYGHFEAVFGGDLSGASTGTVDPDPSEPHRRRRHHRRPLTVRARGLPVRPRQPPPSATTERTRFHKIDLARVPAIAASDAGSAQGCCAAPP